MSTIHYTSCPLCSSPLIARVLVAEDQTVSHGRFEVWECEACTLRFTQDAPRQDQIGRYYQSTDYISHTDTREGLVNSVYHQVRNLTLQLKKNLISNTIEKKVGRVLDIGAGTGAFAKYMKESGWQVTALEPDAATRERAHTINGLDLLSMDQLFSLPASSFDAITMWHVLEHVHELHEYVIKLRELLAPRAAAFIAVPNYTSDDARHYGEHWAAYDVPRHLYHFSPRAMRRLIESHGMSVTDMKPMWFDSFYVSMLGEKYKTGASSNFSAFLEGARSNLAAFKKTAKCSSLIYIVEK